MRALLRLLQALPSLLILVSLTFFLLRAAPGGPFDTDAGLTPQTRAQLEAAYGFDEPLLTQYGRYLGRLLHGDLGPSYQYPDRRVNELIAAGLPVSAALGASALLLGLAGGLALGALAACRAGHWPDRLVSGFALLGLSTPGFVIAPLLILVFAVDLRWLPAGGWSGAPRDAVLPVLALTLPHLAVVAQLARTALVDVLQMPYIRTARAKGLPESLVLWRHALRPALLPVLSYLGPAAAATLTGSVVIEQVFGLPGIGRYFVLGAFNRDYGLVLGVVLLYGSLIVLFNFAVDLFYGVLDPRQRT